VVLEKPLIHTSDQLTLKSCQDLRISRLLPFLHKDQNADDALQTPECTWGLLWGRHCEETLTQQTKLLRPMESP
jgi:hypothetical protein